MIQATTVLYRYTVLYNYWNKDYHAFVRYSYIDQEDNVWLCGKSAIHLFNIESGQKQRISNRLGNITCIEQINSEHFFIGTDKRIYLAKLENGNLKKSSPAAKLGNDGYARTWIISTPYSQQTVYRHFWKGSLYIWLEQPEKLYVPK